MKSCYCLLCVLTVAIIFSQEKVTIRNINIYIVHTTPTAVLIIYHGTQGGSELRRIDSTGILYNNNQIRK